MRVIDNERFVKRIQDNLENSQFYPYVVRVFERLQGLKVYMWGGAVRDPIVQKLHGTSFEMRDFDFTIDDSQTPINFSQLFAGFGDTVITRHNTIKWKPEIGFEIDIGKFSIANIYKRNPDLPRNLCNTLKSVDVTTSANAYDLETRLIYSEKGLEGIEKKEVDVLYQLDQKPVSIMCKLVLHSHKLKFNIGPKGLAYIAHHYSKAMDDKVRQQLVYKQQEEKFPFVKQKLEEIKRLAQ